MADPPHRPRSGHRFHPERRQILKDPERRRWLPPEPILREAGIPAGATALDIGAGTGFWTAPLAALVGPSGKVIATDVEPVMLEELHSLVQTEGIRNVEVVEATELAMPLPDDLADVAVLGFMLHEPSDPGVFLQEVSRVLKPDGRMLVVDWHKRQTESGPPLQHRLSEDDTRDLLRNAGFTAETLAAPNPDVYILVARRA